MWFRRSPVTGAATLIVFLTTLVLPLAGASHHVLGADTDLGRAGARPGIGHPVPQVEVVRPLLAGDHCALCHWARTLGHTVAGRQAWHQPDLMPVWSPVLAIGAPAPGLTDSRTSRGPPSIA